MKTYTHNNTTFMFIGRKWHFITPLPDGKQHEFIAQIRGGHALASRIAPLVDSDVSRLGKLGGQRANINRLIENFA